MPSAVWQKAASGFSWPLLKYIYIRFLFGLWHNAQKHQLFLLVFLHEITVIYFLFFQSSLSA
ncbi:hypothetical protein HMPREF1548_01008 [Clostridium sp. KLE 1755]|nr:hypothetical protein HMPREF1548_01008 [Clostridium sp. KLE 1755]